MKAALPIGLQFIGNVLQEQTLFEDGLRLRASHRLASKNASVGSLTGKFPINNFP
jgi:Asp-tRNA(Asn)/Glu-tRNA(Gln) amidotransferase A subunit family amidase